MITRNEALKYLNQGYKIGFVCIPDVEIWLDDRTNRFVFKHRDGELELLDMRTIKDDNGYKVIGKRPQEKLLRLKKRFLVMGE